MASVPATLDTIRDLLRDRPALVAVYLYGSTARGAPNPRDLDLAVMFAPGVDGFQEALALQVELENLVSMPIDLHDFDALPVDLRFRVLDEGTVLVDRDPKDRVRREIRVQFEYDDFRPHLDRIRAGALRRLTGTRDG